MRATSPTISVDALVEQRSFGALEVRGPFAAHGDVHEARLVDVLAGRVDDGDLDVAAVDPLAELLTRRFAVRVPPTPPPRMRIRCMAGYRSFSTTISS